MFIFTKNIGLGGNFSCSYKSVAFSLFWRDTGGFLDWIGDRLVLLRLIVPSVVCCCIIDSLVVDSFFYTSLLYKDFEMDFLLEELTPNDYIDNYESFSMWNSGLGLVFLMN